MNTSQIECCIKCDPVMKDRVIGVFASDRIPTSVFPVKFQLRGFVPLTPEKWGYKEKNRGTKQN